MSHGTTPPRQPASAQRGERDALPRITVVVGSIVGQPDCEAIVNAANEGLYAGAGVSGAIHDAAGPELEPCARKLAPLGLGQAVITPGFRLANRWVIHVRGPKYFADPEPPTYLAAAVRNAIRLADENGVKRLALPAISTGIYGYPIAAAAPLLVAAASTELPNLRVLQEVRFVVTGAAIAALFAPCIAAATLKRL